MLAYEKRQILQGQPDTTQRHGQTGHTTRNLWIGSGAAHCGNQMVRSDGLQHRNHGDIQRLLQSLPDRNSPERTRQSSADGSHRNRSDDPRSGFRDGSARDQSPDRRPTVSGPTPVTAPLA